MNKFSPKQNLAADLLSRFRKNSKFLKAGHLRDRVPTGIAELEQACPGLPRGSVSEICGGRSSGKTSLLHSILTQATARREFCAIADAGDTFDPCSAQECGVDLGRILWIRCGGKLEMALKTTDILLHGAGFGLVALDIGDFSPETIRKIPMMYWFRFRQAVENTPSAFVVVSPIHATGSCASVVLAAEPGAACWTGTAPFRMLEGIASRFEVARSRDANRGNGAAVVIRASSGASS